MNMHPFKRSLIPNGKYYVILLITAVIAYWPLTFAVFSLKNDAITYFLPWRYQISEAIRNGYFPFWSPYLYTGLPLHSDIQSGVWNPLVFMISLLTRYDMSILQWETFAYIVVAGVGLFKLSRFFLFDKQICLLLAVSYMCCGFIIDSGSFIPWITSAAYLPFVVLYFLKTIRQPAMKSTVKLALSGSLLFLAGYPSYFILASYMLALTSLIYLSICFKNRKNEHAFRLLKHLAAAAFCCLVICAPALISYLEFFPYYGRGSGLNLEAAELNPFAPGNMISYLLPQASYKLHTPNDIISRNAFIGLVPLSFILFSLRKKYGNYQWIILVTTAFCLFFSLGENTPVHGLIYHLLPFANSFRHPATMRVFTSIGLLLLAGFGLNEYVRGQHRRFLQTVILSLVALVLGLIVYGAFSANSLNRPGDIFPRAGLNLARIKELFDSSSFSEWLFITGIIQLFFLALMLTAPKKEFLVAVGIANAVAMGFLSMPFTLISQHRTKEVNSFIHSFPRDFPSTQAWKNVRYGINDRSAMSTFGYKNFYNREISIQDHVVTPTINAKYASLLEDSVLLHSVTEHKFAYMDSAVVSLEKFSPNAFSFRCANDQPTYLHITQQYNHNWYAFVNGQPAKVIPDNIAFMKIMVPAGSNAIRMVYRSTRITVAAYCSLITLLGCIGLVIYFRIKK